MRTQLRLDRPLMRGVAASMLLVSGIVTLLGCGSGLPTESGGPGDIPQTLVGTWRLSAATGSQVCDDLGHCGPAYGGSESYQFASNGHFVYSQFLEANLGGCKQTAFIYATGTVSSDISSVTLHPASLRNQRSNTCGQDSDQTYTTVDPSSYDWRVDEGTQDPEAKGLYLTGSDGEENGPYTRQ
jgi:hypothetical protein